MNQFAKKDMLKSAKYLKKSIQLDPAFTDGYYQLGLLYLEAGQPKGMIRLMQQLLKRDPDDKDALLFSGLGHYRQKKWWRPGNISNRRLLACRPTNDCACNR